MPCTAVIMQPTYLPWLGYFELMARADKFVLMNIGPAAARALLFSA